MSRLQSKHGVGDNKPEVTATDNAPKCRIHKDKLIEYICQDHDQLCCSACLNTTHAVCPSTSYVPEISDTLVDDTSYKLLIKEFEDIQTKTKSTLNAVGEKLQKSKEDNKKALDEMRAFKREVNKVMDELEIDTAKKVTTFNDANTERCNKATKQCISVLSEVKNMLSSLGEKAQQRKKKDRLFVEMKLAEERLSGIKAEVEESRRCQLVTYTLEKENLLTEMRSSLSDMLVVTASHVGSFTKARLLKDINVKSVDESRNCKISGIAVLEKDRIAVTDLKHKSLKLIDTEADKVMSRVSFSTKPCDVAAVGNNKVGVALGDEKKIDVYTVSNTGTLSHEWSIDVDGVCSNLAYSKGQLIIAFENPGLMQITDMRGTVLTTFRTDSNGDELFQTPNAIALSRNHNAVLVTDLHANTVTRLTREGHVVSVYKSDKLKRSTGVAAGSDDSVFVCSADTSTVHQVSPLGALQRIILSKERGLVDRPNAMTCSFEDDRLFISNFSSKRSRRNFIRVYQLEQ